MLFPLVLVSGISFVDTSPIMQAVIDAVQTIGQVLGAFATDPNYSVLRWGAVVFLGISLLVTVMGVLRGG